MRKQLILNPLLILFFFILFTYTSIPLEEEWNRTFGGINSDEAKSVQQTSDGGYILAANTYSFGAGSTDVYLIKTDSLGNEEWSKTYGGNLEDRCLSVQQTSDGGYIVAGYTCSFGAKNEDFYLIKTNSSGNEEWSKVWGGPFEDTLRSVIQTSDGGYIVTGRYFVDWSTLRKVYLHKTDSFGNEEWSKIYTDGGQFDNGFSVQQTLDGGYIVAGEAPANDKRDAFLLKTSSTGSELWSKSFGGTSKERFYSAQQTSDGGYIVAGWTDSFGAGEGDAWLIKTDSSGNEEWSKTFGGLSHDRATSVQQTTDGGYIMVGWTYSFGAGNEDVYVIKTDSSGNEEWSKTFGGSNFDRASSVQQTSDRGYIVAGGTHSFGAGKSDIWLIKIGAELLEVLIDIKPGSDPNSINPKSNGVIPIAILGNANFNVNEVNVSSLRFGYLDYGDGAPPAHSGHFEDVNGDGNMDLVVHFSTQDTGIVKGDTEACLKGETNDGTPLEGCDSIRTVGK